MGIDWLDYWDPTNLPGLVDWLGFTIGSVGIIFAVVQLTRSAGALKAAKESLEKTQAELIFNRLNAAIPELRRLADILGDAIDDDNRPAAAFALNDFPVRVSEIKTLFDLTGGADTAFLTVLTERGQQLIEMRSLVYSRPKNSLRSVIGYSMTPLRELISDVAGAAMQIQTTAQASVHSGRARTN
jgi:hypothetical protein